MKQCPGYLTQDRAVEYCPWLKAEAVRIDGLEKAHESLSGALTRLDSKMDGIKTWIMGTLATAALALLGIVLNLLAKKL